MKKVRNKYKKPNLIVYSIYRLICKVIAKYVFNTKIIRNEIENLDGPYVVLANHESKIDFINLAITTPKRMHLVTSNSFYQTLSVRPLMDMIRVIAKQQFQTSSSDIKKMKRVIDNNMPLAIYPVGLMAENGLSTDPGKSIAKLLKLLKTDVYVCYSEGSYLTQPKWSKVRRKGQITVDVYKLFSKEDVESLSIDELYKSIREGIDYDSYANQRLTMVPFENGDNVEGLEYVLYQCPKCKSEKSIISVNTTGLKCTCCNYEVVADVYGFLNGEEVIYQSPADWSKEIFNNLKSEMEKNPKFTLSDEVIISMINYKKHKFEEVGFGQVSINKDFITLKGKINDEEIEYTFPTSCYPTLPFTPGEYLEIQDGQDIYRLHLKDKYNVTKFINMLKVINNNV